MKRIFAALLVCAVVVSFAACSSAVSPTTGSNEIAMTDAANAKIADGSTGEAGANDTSAEQPLKQQDRKIIYESTLEIEAIDFDATIKALQAALKAVDGYVSNTTLSNNTYEGETRNATYVYRVPADKYSDFLNALGDAGNVTRQQENTQDITAEYVDVEARISSLMVQEERLMAMMEQAGDLETLLAIQNQLTDVQYRIESYTAQQRTFDNQVSYCTVTVDVQEVVHVTAPKDTFGERVSAAFYEGWRGFIAGCESLVVTLVLLMPTLLVLLVIGSIVFVILRALRARAAKRPAANRAQGIAGTPQGYHAAVQPAQYGAQPTTMVQQSAEQYGAQQYSAQQSQNSEEKK